MCMTLENLQKYFLKQHVNEGIMLQNNNSHGYRWTILGNFKRFYWFINEFFIQGNLENLNYKIKI